MAEIYIDESEKNPFAVGGVVLNYPNQKSVDEIDQRLLEAGFD